MVFEACTYRGATLQGHSEVPKELACQLRRRDPGASMTASDPAATSTEAKELLRRTNLAQLATSRVGGTSSIAATTASPRC